MSPTPTFDPYYTWHRAQRPGKASVSEFVTVLRRCGVELFEARKLDRIRVQSRDPLPRDLKKFIRDHKEFLLDYLFQPASPDELAAVAATGRTPSPLLTRAQARLLSLLPAPRPFTPWQLLLDGYESFKPWQRRPASEKQLKYCRSLGVIPPEGATAGAVSYAIDRLKKGGKK
jgi:hypothetical protein